MTQSERPAPSETPASPEASPLSNGGVRFAVAGMVLAGLVATVGADAVREGGVSGSTAVWMVLSAVAAVCGLVAILRGGADLSGPKGVEGGQQGPPELRRVAWTAVGVGLLVTASSLYFFKQFVGPAQSDTKEGASSAMMGRSRL